MLLKEQKRKRMKKNEKKKKKMEFKIHTLNFIFMGIRMDLDRVGYNKFTNKFTNLRQIHNTTFIIEQKLLNSLSQNCGDFLLINPFEKLLSAKQIQQIHDDKTNARPMHNKFTQKKKKKITQIHN